MSKKQSPKAITVDMRKKPEGKLKIYGGSKFDDFNHSLCNQALNSLWLTHSKGEQREQLVHAALHALVGIAPNNEVEGMLATQMIAVHNATMECFRRAMIGEQSFEGRNQNLSFGNKLARTYTGQMEALQKYRGKGQQQMTVIHQHVQVAGGKVAVAGVTNPPTADGWGEGQPQKTEEQPHAKQIEHQTTDTMPPLSCQNARANPVPVPRDGKRAV